MVASDGLALPAQTAQSHIPLATGLAADAGATTGASSIDERYLESQARRWLSQTLSRSLPADKSLSDLLGDGEILLELACLVQQLLSPDPSAAAGAPLTLDFDAAPPANPPAPSAAAPAASGERGGGGGSGGARKSSPSGSSSEESEREGGFKRAYWHACTNVERFLKVCRHVGLKDVSLFTSPDLMDRRDVRRVCLCLRTLSKRLVGIRDFDGILVTASSSARQRLISSSSSFGPSSSFSHSSFPDACAPPSSLAPPARLARSATTAPSSAALPSAARPSTAFPSCPVPSEPSVPAADVSTLIATTTLPTATATAAAVGAVGSGTESPKLGAADPGTAGSRAADSGAADSKAADSGAADSGAADTEVLSSSIKEPGVFSGRESGVRGSSAAGAADAAAAAAAPAAAGGAGAAGVASQTHGIPARNAPAWFGLNEEEKQSMVGDMPAGLPSLRVHRGRPGENRQRAQQPEKPQQQQQRRRQQQEEEGSGLTSAAAVPASSSAAAGDGVGVRSHYWRAVRAEALHGGHEQRYQHQHENHTQYQSQHQHPHENEHRYHGVGKEAVSNHLPRSAAAARAALEDVSPRLLPPDPTSLTPVLPDHLASPRRLHAPLSRTHSNASSASVLSSSAVTVSLHSTHTHHSHTHHSHARSSHRSQSHGLGLVGEGGAEGEQRRRGAWDLVAAAGAVALVGGAMVLANRTNRRTREERQRRALQYERASFTDHSAQRPHLNMGFGGVFELNFGDSPVAASSEAQGDAGERQNGSEGEGGRAEPSRSQTRRPWFLTLGSRHKPAEQASSSGSSSASGSGGGWRRSKPMPRWQRAELVLRQQREMVIRRLHGDRRSMAEICRLDEEKYSDLCRDFTALQRGEEANDGGAEGGVYEVQEGDTLSTIADRFRRSVGEVMRRNPHINDPDAIYPRDRLVL
ncbi:hypothetical protein CLOM_g14336 [Closterium sp. NIES-68]|nr:hypothetical protein CLOM_g14336 [Closterium sp. NIES-68]GJP61678.1 hypothetical protein CLOP_g18827 [Closterium sp. NIES-67]